MGVFEHFPYTNFHDLNLDWVVQELEKLATDVQDFISINAIKYANPIQWDITSQYEKNTVVLDKDGNAYLSVQPVPAGVSLDRTEYWTNIGNFSALWASVKEAITIPDEGYEKTASAPRAVNDLVWVDGKLLEVTSQMAAGDKYIVGSNCRLYTMQIFLTETLDALKQEQQARESADTALQTALVNETQARENLQDDVNGIVRNYKAGNETPIISQKSAAKWAETDKTNDSSFYGKIGGLWPTSVVKSFNMIASDPEINTSESVVICDQKLVVGNQSGKTGTTLESGTYHDFVASQNIAYGTADNVQLFGQNIIVTTVPNVQAKMIGTEIDIQPSTGTTVTEGAGVIVNAFGESMPIPAMAVYGVFGGSFSDALVVRGVTGAAVSAGSDAGTMRNFLNMQNANFTDLAICMKDGHYVGWKSSANANEVYMRDNAGDFELFATKAVKFSTSQKQDLVYLYNDKIGINLEAASTATAGAATLPSNPVGFIPVTLNGGVVKIPIYSV